MSTELLEPVDMNTTENQTSNPCAALLSGQTVTLTPPVPDLEPKAAEYLVVSDTTSEVIMSSEDMGECRKMLTKIRKCNGQVTMFKAMNF